MSVRDKDAAALKEGTVLVCTVGKKEGNSFSLNCTAIESGEVEFEGIVVDEERAKESPCIRINGTNLYFSKGIIGALSKEQVKKYCPEIIEKPPARDVICVHLNDFEKLVKEIEERLKKRGRED